jgi:thiamine biosynthesis protein ThiI
VPASPKTKPRREKVERFESFVDFEPLIQKAVEGIETIQVGLEANNTKTEMDDLF